MMLIMMEKNLQEKLLFKQNKKFKKFSIVFKIVIPATTKKQQHNDTHSKYLQKRKLCTFLLFCCCYILAFVFKRYRNGQEIVEKYSSKGYQNVWRKIKEINDNYDQEDDDNDDYICCKGKCTCCIYVYVDVVVVLMLREDLM